jgi:hypothetical protein
MALFPLNMAVWDAITDDTYNFDELSGPEMRAVRKKLLGRMEASAEKVCDFLHGTCDVDHVATKIHANLETASNNARSLLQSCRYEDDVSFFTLIFDKVRIRYGYWHGEARIGTYNDNEGDILRIEDVKSEHTLDFSFHDFDFCNEWTSHRFQEEWAVVGGSEARFIEVLSTHMRERTHFAELIFGGDVEGFRGCMLRVYLQLSQVVKAIRQQPTTRLDGFARIQCADGETPEEKVYTIDFPIVDPATGSGTFKIGYDLKKYTTVTKDSAFQMPLVHVLRKGTAVLARAGKRESDESKQESK